jgi:hypothetical protein
MKIINEKNKVEIFLESNIKKELFNNLIELRNGERLKPTSIEHFQTTPYGLCYAIRFDTISRYTLYNRHGRKFLDKTSPYDIIDIVEVKT